MQQKNSLTKLREQSKWISLLRKPSNHLNLSGSYGIILVQKNYIHKQYLKIINLGTTTKSLKFDYEIKWSCNRLFRRNRGSKKWRYLLTKCLTKENRRIQNSL